MPKASVREAKAFSLELKSTSESGEFVGVASVYGNKDLQGDVVDRGAFTKTISERGADVPILWQHDPTTPIGKGTLTDTPHGLKITGRLSLGTAKGREAYELLKDGVIQGLSIGYDVIKQKFEQGARHLQELRLYEVSAVTFPANEDALVTDVKAQDLPAHETAMLQAFRGKDASLTDKISAVYQAVQAAFPFANAWVVDVYETYAIVCAGGDRYFSIAVAFGGDGDDVTLGDATEVERVYVPVGQKAETLAHALETKAGARHSRADQDLIQTAHDAIVAAGAKCADLKAQNPGTAETKAAAVASAEPNEAIVHSLRAWNDTLRRLSAA